MSIDIFLNLRVLGDYYHILFTAINQTGKNLQNRKFDFHFWNFLAFLDLEFSFIFGFSRFLVVRHSYSEL